MSKVAVKFNLFLVTLVCLALCSSQAVADGAYIPRVAPDTDAQDLSEPVQRAIVVHFGDMERLILQVSFAGNVSEFAWLIPTPARPELSRDDTFSKYGQNADSFERMHQATAPIVSYWLDPEKSQYMPQARGGSEPKPAPDVEVLEHKVVGDYDAVVLQAKSSANLLDWLHKHDYRVTSRLETVLGEYIRRGWIFTAARINTAHYNKIKQGMLEPLQLQFASEHPIYPLKISSLNPGHTRVILYVITDKYVTARGFHTVYAANQLTPERGRFVNEASKYHAYDMLGSVSVSRSTATNSHTPEPNTPIIFHLTKLTAELDSSQMKNDVILLPAKSQKPVLPEPISAPILDNIGAAFVWLMISPWRFLLAAICLTVFVIESRHGRDGRVWLYFTVLSALGIAVFLVFAVIGMLITSSISLTKESPLGLVLVLVLICLITFLIQRRLSFSVRIWRWLTACIAPIIALVVIGSFPSTGTAYGYVGLMTVVSVGIFACWWLRRVWLLRRKKALATEQQSYGRQV